MNRAIVAQAMLVPVLLTAGCAGRAASRGSDQDPWNSSLTLEIRNQNFASATIYAYRSGERRRLGHIDGLQTDSLSFKWPWVDLRLFIDFLSAGCVLTESMSVDHDDELLLVLQPDDSRRASLSLCVDVRRGDVD